MEQAGRRRKELAITLCADWTDVAVFNMGVDGFNEYKKQVCAALDKLRTGHYYDLISSVPIYRREIFLGICIHYIESHPDYEMTDNNCRIYNKTKI